MKRRNAIRVIPNRSVSERVQSWSVQKRTGRHDTWLEVACYREHPDAMTRAANVARVMQLEADHELAVAALERVTKAAQVSAPHRGSCSVGVPTWTCPACWSERIAKAIAGSP
ncbi:hypothetical protein SEA_NANCYRAE_66 [Gordonia phage NancyRae]|uniref:Uncharacterized protein n=1 Tax=Gordonia phage NancyRae TaxID=2793698 RepID=A0A7T0M0S7_9CAUD|nr:hypothetical protein SEA_NANCYRAE_66 [Gordonia phage NancyRae]